MHISPDYTDNDWKVAFQGGEHWDRAIAIVKDRIEGWWLRWADELAPFRFSGFAVLALDCIVLESLWGFMNGKGTPKGSGLDVYRDILKGPRFGWTDKQCDDFREFVRNGLMHDAETRKGWLVEKSIPRNSIVKQSKHGDYRINRTRFHQALKAAVADWINELRRGQDIALRKNMRKRMDQIISKHFATR